MFKESGLGAEVILNSEIGLVHMVCGYFRVIYSGALRRGVLGDYG